MNGLGLFDWDTVAQQANLLVFRLVFMSSELVRVSSSALCSAFVLAHRLRLRLALSRLGCHKKPGRKKAIILKQSTRPS